MAKKNAFDFEKVLMELEALVLRMEEEMPLDAAMAAYEESVKLHKTLSEALEQSEKKLKMLSRAEEP